MLYVMYTGMYVLQSAQCKLAFLGIDRLDNVLYVFDVISKKRKNAFFNF